MKMLGQNLKKIDPGGREFNQHDPLPSDKKQSCLHGKTSQQVKKQQLHSSSKKVAKLQGRWQTSRKVAKLQAQHAELMIFILNLFSRSAKF